jgi:NAD(P)-dependent dehydrogenase (short-subunit alcohol dehydrogenase family)
MSTINVGKRLEGKVALISGAASGIGAQTARTFAAHGASIMACDVNTALGEAVVQEINDAGGSATFRPLEVLEEDAWFKLVAETEGLYGKVDILGNIAGISGRDPKQNVQTTVMAGGLLEDQSLEVWNKVMDINVTGTFLGTKAVLPAMKRAGGGSIINISSICGIVGSHANGAYHASKGAVRIFSKSVAVQYAADQIRCNSVHPGFVDTPMTAPGHANPEVKGHRMDVTPMGRFGVPQDIANGCLFLASDESSWVTGTELVIDGGLTAY